MATRSPASSTMPFVALAVTMVVFQMPQAVLGGEGDACTSHKYLIVGAGPGSMQMAHYLESAGRDYLLLEGSGAVANFFRKYPRWRKLISLNKRHTGNPYLDHNLRHDWNSLLSDPSVANPRARNSSTFWSIDEADPDLLFRHYSDELWPPADALVKYMEVFAKKRRLKIRFNHMVEKISKRDDGTFFVKVKDQQENFCAKYLFMGTGPAKPSMLPTWTSQEPRERTVVGGNVETYHNASTNKKDYEGQRVLIIGRGNSAFEFAQNIMGNTQYVHVMAREGRVKMAWETHYPGAVRTLHNTVLETYMLKSMDVMFEEDLSNSVFEKKKDGLWYIRAHGDPTGVIECSEEGYHRIVVCLGITFDTSIFDASCTPTKTNHAKYEGKFPKLNVRYEAANVTNLFFLGSPMHSNDYKQAAGGFIHGFRYLVRSLHRILEQDEEKAVEWPTLTWKMKSGETEPDVLLLNHTVTRLNTMGGPYQMFGQLADIVVVNTMPSGEATFTYREEVPLRYAPYSMKKWCKRGGVGSLCGFVAITMEYGRDPRPVGKRDVFAENRVGSTGETSHFLHPIFRVFAPSRKGGWAEIEKTQLAEHSLTDWSGSGFQIQMQTVYKRVHRSQRAAFMAMAEKKKKNKGA